MGCVDRCVKRVRPKRITLVPFQKFIWKLSLQPATKGIRRHNSSNGVRGQLPQPKIREKDLQKTLSDQPWVVLQIAGQLRTPASPGTDFDKRCNYLP